MKHLILLLIVGEIICSCTITKRHFGNGYHVEWNRKIKTAPNSPESSKMESSDAKLALKNTDTLIPSETGIVEEVFATTSVIKTQVVIEDQPVEEPPFQSEAGIQKERQIKTAESSKIKETEDETEEAPQRSMHPLMWGIWGMWSIAIACMFFVTFYVEALIGVALGFFIAMIFALIVLRSLRKNPVKQPFKGLSYGFGIPAIVFGVIASVGVGLILVILFFA